MLLNNFVHFFKINFKNLCPIFCYVLQNIVRRNENFFLKYLMNVKSVSAENNFHYYELWSYKLSVANFIKNTCFISVSKFFKNNKLAIKNNSD